MESSISASPGNFSAIARRLLLNRKSPSVTNTVAACSNSPVTFCDLPPAVSETTHAEDLLGCSASTSTNTSSTGEGCKSLSSLYGSYLLPSVPKRPRRAKVMPTSPAEPISEAAHDCNELCDRVRALTPEVLTAPLEKPYEPVRGSRRDAVARPSIGPEAKNMIRHVRAFFEEVRRQLGERACYGTVLNSAVQMAALACGVSQGFVTRLRLNEEKAWNHVKNKRASLKSKIGSGSRSSIRMVSLKQYGEEWGDVVRHFVHNQLEQEVNVTVTDLHTRLVCAYSDFPMPPQTLYAFLKALGFSYRVEGNKSYIVSDSKVVKKEEA